MCVEHVALSDFIWCQCGTFQRVHVRTSLDRKSSFCWTAGPHIGATCVFGTRSPNETHIGFCRSADSADAFLEAHSQADKEGTTVTTQTVFRELFDRHFTVIVLFLLE